MPFSGVMTATVLVCFLLTLMMGVYARLPFAVAPGMGINAFFAFSIIIGNKIPWPVALGIIFWSGVLFILVSVTPLRVLIAKSIPRNLRMASAAGIGVFLTFIGLKNAELIQSDPVTMVKISEFGTHSFLAVVGLVVILGLMRRKSAFAFLAGVFAVTALAAFSKQIQVPAQLTSWPDFSSVFFKLDILGALKLSLVPAMISILFTDLFDSISTFIGVSHSAGMLDENGDPIRLKEGLIVDAFATMLAGLFGTSSGTAFIESSAGIEVGARTGLASVVTAFCFLPCFFLAPLAGMVPAYATAPVLIIVGALMFRSVRSLEVTAIEDLVPAYLTVVLIPLTFSITQGILWGFFTHVLLYWLAGRSREVHPVMKGLGLLAIVLLALRH
jgi:AGZA family xanthine/uracil permease-like MFS transporter